MHLVSAWATQAQLSLGQVAVDGKSNEITAIPQLLELLDLQGAVVTIDAIGCQKAIAQKIVVGGGDYVLVVKGNQEKLLDDIQQTLTRALEGQLPAGVVRQCTTTERGHGRQEERSCVVVQDVAGITARRAWPQLRVVGLCRRERTVKGQSSTEVCYFIGSRRMGAGRYAQALRHHWGIENSCHWSLDMTFREDESRIREPQIRENFAWLNRFILSLLKQHPGKDSIAMKRRGCGWSDDFLLQVFAGTTP